MAKGTRGDTGRFDQTYLSTQTSIEIHRDYAAHYFRWGFAKRFGLGKKVLDAGCGPEHMQGRVLIDHGRPGQRPTHYVGVDLNDLEPKRTDHKTLIGRFDFTARWPELVEHFGKFDVVTSFEVIEHMPVEDGARYLAGMVGCLAPGGTLLLSTPRNEGAPMARNHIHEYSTAELKAAIEAAGLTIVKRYGTYGDKVKLRKAASATNPAYRETMDALEEYYEDDVISCFLTPLFPDDAKNNLWVCQHRDPTVIDPGPERGRMDHTWPVGVSTEVDAPAETRSEDSAGAPEGDPARAEADAAPEAAEEPETCPHGCPEEGLHTHLTRADEPVEFISAVAAPAGPRPPVLVINTYAGSILLGAVLAGAEVEAVLEDCGYGAEMRKLNFPDVKSYDSVAAWPDVDLSDRVVIGHPPCAAFSNQAIGTRKKAGTVHGLQNEAFKETIQVIRYALSHNAGALAVESVQGAYEGARTVHDDLAAEYGYNVYRLLQNAATFGVPQWRPRFWAVFTKANRFAAWHTPVCRTVSHVLDGRDPGELEDVQEKRFEMQREILDRELGAGAGDRWLGTPGVLCRNLAKELKVADLMEITPKYCVGTFENVVKGHNPKQRRFVSATIRLLDPDGYACVIVRDSWFGYKGRNVRPQEYRSLMGFPRNYKLDAEYRSWLSKGVVPAVAAWVIELLQRNMTKEIPSGARWLQPGDTADFQIDKGTWHKLAAGENVPVSFQPRPPELIRRPASVTRVLGPDAKVDSEFVECEAVPDHNLPDPSFEVKTPEPKRRAHRVEQEYFFPGVTAAQVSEALATTRQLIVPPCKFAQDVDGGALAVVQYEPPNAGGGRHDTDRMAMRAAKKLECEWRRV